MKFTDSHEWIKIENENVARMGITSYAQDELGDIVYVELPLINRKINARQEIAVLESTKAAADIYSPITGIIIEVNTRLVTEPELINHHAQSDGWICKIQILDTTEIDLLMDETDYQAMLNGA
jgi:glycine cleavage system H protein